MVVLTDGVDPVHYNPHLLDGLLDLDSQMPEFVDGVLEFLYEVSVSS